MFGGRQGAAMGGSEMTGDTPPGRWPDEWGDENEDFHWPDDDNGRPDDDDGWPDEAGTAGQIRSGAAPDAHVPVHWGVPPAPAYPRPVRRRIRSVLALAGTAVLACGLGGAAVLVYRAAEPGPAAAAAPSQGAESEPGQGGGPAGQAPVELMTLLGRVTAVDSGTLTIAAGPQPVTAAVVSGTRFTGPVRTLAAVRVGDVVAAEIAIVDGRARVISLQDPASD
jgi:hypothetical protein